MADKNLPGYNIKLWSDQWEWSDEEDEDDLWDKDELDEDSEIDADDIYEWEDDIFCSNCGAEVTDGFRCEICGALIGGR